MVVGDWWLVIGGWWMVVGGWWFACLVLSKKLFHSGTIGDVYFVKGKVGEFL